MTIYDRINLATAGPIIAGARQGIRQMLGQYCVVIVIS
jgi:hypothetical protein